MTRIKVLFYDLKKMWKNSSQTGRSSSPFPINIEFPELTWLGPRYTLEQRLSAQANSTNFKPESKTLSLLLAYCKALLTVPFFFPSLHLCDAEAVTGPSAFLTPKGQDDIPHGASKSQALPDTQCDARIRFQEGSIASLLPHGLKGNYRMPFRLSSVPHTETTRFYWETWRKRQEVF